MRRAVVVVTAIGLLILAAGAGAASRWVITNTRQIKPSVLAQLARAKGPKGPQGPTGPGGPRGPAGPAGASGSVGKIDTVVSETLTLQPGQTSYDVDPNNFQANCPNGEYVIGTGFDAGIGQVDFVLSYTFFVGGFFDNNAAIPIQVHLQAICAAVPYGLTASVRARTNPKAAYQTDLTREEALPAR